MLRGISRWLQCSVRAFEDAKNLVGGLHTNTLLRTVALLLMLVPAWAPLPVRAMEATPTPSSPGEPIYPSANECTRDPRGTEEILLIVAKGLQEPWDGIAQEEIVDGLYFVYSRHGTSIWLEETHLWVNNGRITPIRVPSSLGTSISPDVVPQLSSFTREYAACVNSGRVDSVFAFLTADMVEKTASEWAYLYSMRDLESWHQVLLETPVAGWVLPAPTVDGAIQLPDGRILVVLVFDNPADHNGERALFVLHENKDSWLIDGIYSLEPSE